MIFFFIGCALASIVIFIRDRLEIKRLKKELEHFKVITKFTMES
jgi:hypothetical protein